MADKLIKGMNEELWRKFTGFCKMKGVKTTKQLEIVLKRYLDEHIIIKDEKDIRGGKK